MSLITVAEYVSLFGVEEASQLTTPNGAGYDAPVIQRALDRASEEIIGLIRRRAASYDGSLVPASVRDATGDVARYYLHGQQVPELVKERKQAALSFAKDSVFTNAELGLSDVTENGAPRIASGTAPPRTFTDALWLTYPQRVA